jgi:molecular chaperone DnaK (HSP70)
LSRFSGVAWALSTSPNDIVIISSWETEDIPRSTDLHKVPSILTYNSSGEVTSWGYRLDEERNAISWFKLLLSEQATQKLAEDQPDRYERLQVLLKNFNKEPVDVAADYLRSIWKHVKNDIEEKIDDWLWDNLKLKIVLTVPAIWDHKAQEMTRKAAEKAGLLEKASTSLELIGEPESAALEVFTEMRIQKRGNLNVRMSFCSSMRSALTAVGG